MKQYDLIIIGGGAGAFASAIKANELKAKTVMINAGLPLGGTCVNVGCVPSKKLLWAGEVLHMAKNHKIPGIVIQVKSFNFQKVVKDELNLVNQMRREKYENVLKHLEFVSHIKGRAKFVSKNEIEVNGKKLRAKKFIIATGSTANVPPIEGIKKSGYLTHVEALKLKKLPKKLAIVGAGPVGLELAQMFARFGTKVTVLQRSAGILPMTEKEISQRLIEILKKEGVDIVTNASVEKTSKRNNKKELIFSVGNKRKKLVVDEIILAAGKTPNTNGLGLDLIGIAINEKQAVVVNKNFQTSQKHVFAVGDVTSLPLRLETTAGKEGTLAAENALASTKNKIDYNTVPYTIFTDPQVAGVGLTEEAQIKQTGTCACRTVSFKYVPKAVIMNRTEGLIKMAIHPKTRQILGVHILAPNASELIAEAMMLIKNKNTIDDVINSLPMFPTLSEAIKVVALSFVKDVKNLSCCI